MKLEKVGIKSFYYNTRENGDFKFKENLEDFVVQEITQNGVCCIIKPIIDIEKYFKAKEIISKLPISGTKSCRKEIYDIARYFPFKRLKTVEDTIVGDDRKDDVFVCTLMKFDLNTSDAVSILSNRLGIPKSNIQFSGNKDRKGITFQEISINCNFERLFNYAISLDRNRSYMLEEYGYCSSINDTNRAVVEEMNKYMNCEITENLDKIKLFDIRKGSTKRLGDHLGNQFIIRIKGLTEIKNTPRYFYNYFGSQRFGKNMNNHLIGKYILEGEYDKALDMILEIEENGEEEIENKKDDSYKCYSPVQKYIFRMREKKEKPKFIVYSIDRTSRMMYMHAYQSFLFNNSINERVENGKIQQGDKILISEEFQDPTQDIKLEDIYIPLVQGDDKFMKGGYRKMIEEIRDFEYKLDETGATLKFSLNKSAYATSALREIIGDSVYEIDK